MKSSKKKKVRSVIIIMLLIVFAIFMVGRLGRNQSGAKQEQKEQIESVEIQDLSKSIGATGTIVSKKSKSLSVSLTDTEVKKVYVEEGDVVKKGDLLMKFDVSDVKQNLDDAKNSLANQKERNSLSNEDAARNVTNAETTREQQIKAARENMDNAEQDWKDAKKEYQTAKQELESLQKEEKDAKALYLQTNDEKTKAAYEAAVTASKQQEQNVSTSKQKMDSAEKTYSSQKNAYEQTVTAQDNSVATAKSNQKSTKLSEDTSSLESQVRQYQKQYDKGILIAPFDGVVTTVNYDKGDTYNGGVAVVLQDCSKYKIEAEISEYDIGNVEVGQKVLIKTDATGEDILNGKVAKIATTSSSSNTNETDSAMSMSSAVSTSNDVTYKVQISFDEPQDCLKLDMTASLSIILEEHSNALVVPYSAVQTKDDGTYFVTTVSDEGTHKDISVSIVMESNYYTEISADIEEGTKVVVIDQNEDSSGISFGSGGAGGPMVGGGF